MHSRCRWVESRRDIGRGNVKYFRTNLGDVNHAAIEREASEMNAGFIG